MPSLVRRQCLRLALYRMVLPVRRRIHWGMGRFCFAFLASLVLVRVDLCDGIVTTATAPQHHGTRGGHSER